MPSIAFIPPRLPFYNINITFRFLPTALTPPPPQLLFHNANIPFYFPSTTLVYSTYFLQCQHPHPIATPLNISFTRTISIIMTTLANLENLDHHSKRGVPLRTAYEEYGSPFITVPLHQILASTAQDDLTQATEDSSYHKNSEKLHRPSPCLFGSP